VNLCRTPSHFQLPTTASSLPPCQHLMCFTTYTHQGWIHQVDFFTFNNISIVYYTCYLSFIVIETQFCPNHMLFCSTLLYILLGHCIRDYLVYPTWVCIWCKTHQVLTVRQRRSCVVWPVVGNYSTEHKHGKCYLWIKTKLKQNDMKYTCYNNINQVYDRHYKLKYLSNILLGHCIRDYLVYPTLVCVWCKTHQVLTGRQTRSCVVWPVVAVPEMDGRPVTKENVQETCIDWLDKNT
jgi:hypothetical protein